MKLPATQYGPTSTISDIKTMHIGVINTTIAFSESLQS